MAGVQGNGQTELVEALTGLARPLSGQIVAGRATIWRTRRPATSCGPAWPTSPRTASADGLVPSFPIADNLVLNTLRPGAVRAAACRMDREAIDRTPRERVKEFDVRTPSIEAPAGTLSGGNQQKVDRRARVLAADQAADRLAADARRSTSARSSSSTSGSCGSATRAWRCCWSRPSWTRCWRWPTGSP